MIIIHKEYNINRCNLKCNIREAAAFTLWFYSTLTHEHPIEGFGSSDNRLKLYKTVQEKRIFLIEFICIILTLKKMLFPIKIFDKLLLTVAYSIINARSLSTTYILRAYQVLIIIFFFF